MNNLNEYTAVGAGTVVSDVKGNVQTYNGWTYTYDAQNRLRVAQGGGKTLEFWYDGNRQITRRINGDNNRITRSVWDGWDLLEERDVNDAPVEYYVHGARTDELVLRWGGLYGDTWYGYDGRGNVSHLFGYNGITIERYTYDLAGAPTIMTPNGQSLVENRFLFQGRDYLKEGGIYDYRNRFYHPALGRFLQPDPIGFKGDADNLYRYCGNDPVDKSDPMGLYETPLGGWDVIGSGKSASYEIDKYRNSLTAQPAGNISFNLQYQEDKNGLELRFSPGYPTKGAGGKPIVQRALARLKDTERGRYLKSIHAKVEIRPTDSDNPHMGLARGIGSQSGKLFLMLNPNDSRFYDSDTFRQMSKYSSERPPDTDAGRAAIIGHELGHLKGLSEIQTVRLFENPIRVELELDRRRTYHGEPVPYP